MKTLNINQQEFLAKAQAFFKASGGVFKNREMLDFAASTGLEKKDWNWVFNDDFKLERGLYKLPDDGVQVTQENVGDRTATHSNVSAVQMTRGTQAAPASQTASKKFDPNALSEYNHAVVPERDKHYVPFGDFKDIETIVRSSKFYPVFIAGLSGNGKTFMVEQACSRAKRPMVRVQMSRETDEDDLIGGFRLIDGETKYLKGPVLRAMELGALLLIDEADRADPGKVMCLQGVLEGKPYYVKKTGEVVTPQPGFNVIVTANTKGKGSDDGRYVAAGILDDAWLERFPITIEQRYPSVKVEARILTGYMQDGQTGDISEDDKQFVSNLISWADIIRKTFDEGAVDEVISTRRLVHIVRTYRIFDCDRMRAITLCCNRFDAETKNSFLELYTKVDDTVNPAATQAPAAEKAADASEEDPF